MTEDRMAPDRASINALLDESSVLLRRGIAMAGTGDQAAALRCFDRAAEMRRLLPLDANPEHAYDLAACDLNRGEALLHLPPVDPRAAIDAFDAGITLLQALPVHAEPRYLRRLAVGLHNRALAHLATGAAAHARRDLERTIALLSPREREHEDEADIALRARHLLCADFAARLTASQADDGLAAAATDVAEEALDVFAAWEQRGVSCFRPLGVDFFAFALAVYGQCQPQFVDEFIHEWRDPSRSSEGFASDPNVLAAAGRRGRAAPTIIRFELDPPPAPDRPPR